MMRSPTLRKLILALVLVLGAWTATRPVPAWAQQLGEGMERSGLLDIRNDNERRVFSDLLCTCGCPRETIATCTCGFATGFRQEVRAMMARGLTEEDIKAEWVRQHGPAALAIPSSEGSGKLLYVVPLVAIMGMAVVVIMTLRRFRKRDVEIAGGKNPGPAVAGGARDEYDAKLDDELRQLDDE